MRNNIKKYHSFSFYEPEGRSVDVLAVYQDLDDVFANLLGGDSVYQASQFRSLYRYGLAVRICGKYEKPDVIVHSRHASLTSKVVSGFTGNGDGHLIGIHIGVDAESGRPMYRQRFQRASGGDGRARRFAR